MYQRPQVTSYNTQLPMRGLCTCLFPLLGWKPSFCPSQEQLFTVSPREVLLKARVLLYALDPLLDGEQAKEQEAAEKTFPRSLSYLFDSYIFCYCGHRAFKEDWRAGKGTPGSHPSSQDHLPMDSTSQAWEKQVTGVRHKDPWLEVKGCRVNRQMDSDCLGGSPILPPVLRVPGL